RRFVSVDEAEGAPVLVEAWAHGWIHGLSHETVARAMALPTPRKHQAPRLSQPRLYCGGR
ncbi:hypothetical protein, partial [Nocardia africana]|uniref:hypothetical protein n=1 Tax=Nocardia africana TaxID=134964 RepID=UPI001C3F5EFA